MPNFKKSPAGGPSAMKMYGKGKNPIMLTKEAQTKIMASDANPKFKKAIANSPIEMYGKSPAKKYKSDAQRKAVHASKNEKGSMAKMYGKTPAKFLGLGKSARQKRARRHEEEDRKRTEEQRRNDGLTGYSRGGKMPFMQ